MRKINVYFSDFFEIDEEVVEEYGALNISLITDLPLFIDPFLLFNSDKIAFQEIHNSIIKYLMFLQRQAEQKPILSRGMMQAWYMFPEVKQTWLGFSEKGNSGQGLGVQFAQNLHKNLGTIFKNFGEESVEISPHLEKLCLISLHVGRDKISDFTTNLSKQYLLGYTENFAKIYLSEKQCRNFTVQKALFNYETMTWQHQKYLLPCFNNDYVLLTPKDILTRDETFINRKDMLKSMERIATSIEDSALRFELDNYFTDVLRRKNKEIPKTEKDKMAVELIRAHPKLIDYYLKYKEDNEEEATSNSKQVVSEAEMLFNDQIQKFIEILSSHTSFYSKHMPDSFEEAKKRVLFLKHAIEDKDCYRLFYIEGKPVRREKDLQIMYDLVWYASEVDINREVNNGRGPVDFKISYGSGNATLVEFKLASNKSLKQNLKNQVEIYKKANNIEKAIKVIMYFTTDELTKIETIFKELNIRNSDEIILIDARNDNKPSGSRA